MKIPNSRTRSWMEVQDPRRQSGVSNVVRITSQSERPVDAHVVRDAVGGDPGVLLHELHLRIDSKWPTR
jgi:hypothetical protein